MMTWISFSTMREIAENTWNGMSIKGKEYPNRLAILNQQDVLWSDSQFASRAEMDLKELEHQLGWELSMSKLIDDILESSDDERLD